MSFITQLLPVLSFLVSLTTLWSFTKARRSEAEERGRRQANLDNAIKSIQDAVTTMSSQIVKQQDSIDKLKLNMELLLQQHEANHGQEIRRCS